MTTLLDSKVYAAWLMNDVSGSTTASNSVARSYYPASATYNLFRVTGAGGTASFGATGVENTSVRFTSSASLRVDLPVTQFTGAGSIGGVCADDWTLDFAMMVSKTGSVQTLADIFLLESKDTPGASDWRGIEIGVTGTGAGPYTYNALRFRYGTPLLGFTTINWPYTPNGSGSWDVIAITHKLSGSTYNYSTAGSGTQMLYNSFYTSGSSTFMSDSLGIGPDFKLDRSASVVAGRFTGSSLQFDNYSAWAILTSTSPLSSSISMSSPFFTTIASSSNYTVDFNVRIPDVSLGDSEYVMFNLCDWWDWSGEARGAYCRLDCRVPALYNPQKFYWFFTETTGARPTTGYLNLNTHITSTTSPQSGLWYHVAVRRSGSEMKMFVNGVPEVSKTLTGDTDIRSSLHAGVTSSDQVFVGFGGFNAHPGTYALPGRIDKFRVSSESRSEADLLATYTANSSSFVAWINATASTTQSGIKNAAAYSSISNNLGVYCNQTNLTGGFYGIDRLRLSIAARTDAEIIALGSGSSGSSYSYTSGRVSFPDRTDATFIRPLQRAIPDASRLPYPNIMRISSSYSQMSMTFDQPVAASGTKLSGTTLAVTGVAYLYANIDLSVSTGSTALWNVSKLNPGVN